MPLGADMFDVNIGQGMVVQQGSFTSGQIEQRGSASFGQDGPHWHAELSLLANWLFGTKSASAKSKVCKVKFQGSPIGTAHCHLRKGLNLRSVL